MNSLNWVCPYCSRHQTIDKTTEAEYVLKKQDLWQENDRIHQFEFEAIKCQNSDCERYTLKANIQTGIRSSHTYYVTDKKIHSFFDLKPASEAKPQPDYIPKAIIDDYKEACLIKNLSPKASASLCRRCLQGMIRDFFDIKDKQNLYQEISAIEDLTDPDIWESIDTIRSIGNIGAHMEKDVNLIVDVDPDEAQILINLIEQLFEDWYVTRYKKRDKLEAAKALKKSKNDEKESKTKKLEETKKPTLPKPVEEDCKASG